MPGRIDFSLAFNRPGATTQRKQDSRYRIYILGNFSGHTDTPWEQRKILPINIDSIDQIMAGLMPTVVDANFRLSFETLDDFHPDICLLKVPILADLLNLKQELSNPATASQAAAKIQAFLPADTETETPEQPRQASESQEEMLERLLGRKPETKNAEFDTVEVLVRRMVSPYISKEIEPQHQTLVKIIDATVCQYLRGLLHRSDFRSLEALWRATASLVNEEASDEHDFFLIDIGRNELFDELKSGNRQFERKLLEHIGIGDGEKEVLLVGNFEFFGNSEDHEFLDLCNRLANACRAFFLAAVSHAWGQHIVSGQPDVTQQWAQFRRQNEVGNVILAYPRYLLRLPYGGKRDPIEAIAFEECSAVPQMDELLWGNPAFLLARVFVRASRAQAVENIFSFNDTPCFTYEFDGQQKLQSGTEVVLSESQAHALLAQGIMPVIGYHQHKGVRLIAVSSLSGVE